MIPPIQSAAPDRADPAGDAKIRRAAFDFQAILFRQLVAEGLKTVGDSGPFGGAEGGDLMQGFLEEALASDLSEQTDGPLIREITEALRRT